MGPVCVDRTITATKFKMEVKYKMFDRAFFDVPWHEYVKKNPVVKFVLTDGSCFNVSTLIALDGVIIATAYDDEGKPSALQMRYIIPR
jgi:hypothetical protein